MSPLVDGVALTGKGRTRLRIVGMGIVVLALFVVGGGLLFGAAGVGTKLAGGSVFGLGTGMLALTLGMRHAFDADHITAIDNTTRKMIAEGRRPTSVGFFFSLGHSTVVFLLAVLLGIGVKVIGPELGTHGSLLSEITGVVGTAVSGLFLYLIAALNIVVMLSVVRAFGRARRGQFNEAEFDSRLRGRTIMGRLLGRFSRGVDRPWKMYPVGVLFGLGFDTATEVALLVLSGGAVASGLSLTAVLALPLLFAAGMCALDTVDGLLMNAAYAWAFEQPARRIYYNAVVTGLSVIVAIAVGTAEFLALLGTQFNLAGGFWRTVDGLDLNTVGYLIVGLFVTVWVVAILLWKLFRPDRRAVSL